MTPTPRSLTATLAIVLAAMLFPYSSALAQTQLRSQLIERTRDRQNEAIENTNRLAQNSVKSLTDRLPASVTENENASTVINAVTSRVGEELENQSTEDLIKAAQQRIKQSKEGNPRATTITDTTQGATAPATVARPMIPEPAASARPVAAPRQAPIATPTRTVPPANQLITQATPAPTPPPGIGAPGAVPAPVPLRPRYDENKSASSEVMEIESDESVMDNERRLITFTGNVIVTEPRFTLTSDQLDVWMNDDTNLDGSPTDGAAAVDGEEKPPFKRAIATGGMVEIEKIGADGKIQIAKARKADYDAATGDIVLSGGPPTLQSGAGFVNPSSPDAIIILRADGNHQINGGTGGRNKLQIPLKGGAAKTSGGPLSGSLDSISNRNNR